MPFIYTHLVSTLSTFYLVSNAFAMGLYFDPDGTFITHLGERPRRIRNRHHLLPSGDRSLRRTVLRWGQTPPATPPPGRASRHHGSLAVFAPRDAPAAIPFFSLTVVSFATFGLLVVSNTILDPFGSDPEDFALLHFVEYALAMSYEVRLPPA